MGVSARKPTQALLLIQLKILQRLGYFELLSTLPRVIVDHVCSSAQMRVPTMRELKAYDASGSRSRHLQKIRDFIGVQRFVETDRSEEHTSELQSLMRISYAVFCLNTK